VDMSATTRVALPTRGEPASRLCGQVCTCTYLQHAIELGCCCLQLCAGFPSPDSTLFMAAHCLEHFQLWQPQQRGGGSCLQRPVGVVACSSFGPAHRPFPCALYLSGFQPRYHSQRALAAAQDLADLAKSKGISPATLTQAWAASR